jgi:asparagine synthase (glutamine-hydrolysing)
MTDFCGRLARDGCLTLDGANGCATIEEYVGCQVLVSGYIGDRAALCRTLGLGPPRRPNDAELLAHAFRRWGVDIERHVIGVFAAVIADRNARVVLFTHDSLGLVPLFHAQDPAGFAFSTTLLALLDSRRCTALDEDYLAEFLATGAASGRRTPFPSIQRLLPGHSLWWSDGRISECSGWSFGDIPQQQCRNDGEYEARLRAELDAGVASALGTEGKTWVFLSGGLDSSSIACMAARRGGSQLAAYSTVHQAWPSVDEQPWMKAVIDETGLDWHKLDIETMLPFSRLPESFLGEPTHAVIDVAEHGRQAGLIREHGVSTLLTGHGGDVTFGATASAVPVHLSDALFDLRPMQALRDADRWRRDAHERRSTAFWMLRGLVEPALHHLSGRRVSGREPYDSPPWFQPDYARSRGLERHGRLRLGPRCRHPGRQATADALWVCGMAMATVPPNQIGLRARSPLMYRPLVEFMWSIPWNQVLQPRCDRYLQRRALKGVLPELVRGRAGKSEGTTVLSEGLRRSRQWIDYLCDTPLMAAHGIVDAEKWRQAVRQASVGHTHGDKHFLACVAVETWFKQLEVHRAGLRGQ